jgi:hypothetical protein
MIPVAYDKADATTKPQLPNAQKLVMQSLFYGFILTALSLIFIFTMDLYAILPDPINTYQCTPPTRGFIWFHLVLVTELAIFSVRAPSFILFAMPSIWLIGSVLLTCIVSGIIGVFYSDLALTNIGFIVAFNVALVLFVDVLKIWFRDLIDDSPGDIIEGDELIQLPEQPDTVKFLEKEKRYAVHRASVLDAADLEHQIEIIQERPGWRGAADTFFRELRPTSIGTGYVVKRKTVSDLSGMMARNYPSTRTSSFQGGRRVMRSTASDITGLMRAPTAS